MGMQIIPVQETDIINGEVIKTVNARDLHGFLEVGKDFSNWIKQRIDKYGFVQGVDYTVLAKTGEAQPCGLAANRKDYFITLDMAKELSMVERNEKGKQARQYFIQCEKKVKSAQPSLPTNYVSALEQLLESTKREMEANRQLTIAAPKVAFADRVSNSEGSMSRRNAAKCLNHPPLAFNKWLKDNRFSNRDGMPAQTDITRGHQRVVVGEHGGRTHSSPYITAKGLLYYATKLYIGEIPDEVLESIEEFKAGISD